MEFESGADILSDFTEMSVSQDFIFFARFMDEPHLAKKLQILTLIAGSGHYIGNYSK